MLTSLPCSAIFVCLIGAFFLGHPVPLPLFLWQLLQSWSSSPNWWLLLCNISMELEFSKRRNHWSDGNRRTTCWHTWKAQHRPRYEKDRRERWERPREKASSSVLRPSGRDWGTTGRWPTLIGSVHSRLSKDKNSLGDFLASLRGKLEQKEVLISVEVCNFSVVSLLHWKEKMNERKQTGSTY